MTVHGALAYTYFDFANETPLQTLACSSRTPRQFPLKYWAIPATRRCVSRQYQRTKTFRQVRRVWVIAPTIMQTIHTFSHCCKFLPTTARFTIIRAPSRCSESRLKESPSSTPAVAKDRLPWRQHVSGFRQTGGCSMTCVATRLRYIYLKICDERQKEKLRSALDQNRPRYISQYPADAPGVARTTSGPNGTIYNQKSFILDSNTILVSHTISQKGHFWL